MNVEMLFFGKELWGVQIAYIACTIFSVYRKHPNLVRNQVEIISDPNYLVRILWKIIFKAPNLVRTSYFSGNLKEKVLELRSKLFFLFHKSL